MKKIALHLSLLLLTVLTVFSFTACANNDGYSKADVDAFIARLDEAIAQKADATESAIATLKADYNAKIEALEEENEILEASIESESSENAAAIQAAITQNEAKITALRSEMQSEISKLQNEYMQKLAEVNSVISALEEADLSYAARITIIESQIAELLSAHQHKCGAWVDYSGNGNISCENRLYYRVCSECNMLEWKKGSEKDHLYGTEYDYDDAYHWQTCTICGDASDKVNHVMDSKQICSDCGMIGVQGWLLEGVPGYKGGTPASELYIAGQGYANEQPLENENLMQAVSGTTAAEFSAYLQKLAKSGFESEFYREANDNLFASYIKEDVRVYAYFMSRTGEARIVKEDANMSVSLSDFSYTYTPTAGEQSVIYQFAVEMADETHTKEDGYKNNGMLYIIKLADNSVVIIDGAQYNQFPEARRKALLSFLREITGTPTTEKIKIAAWYITHAHSDHHAGMRRFFDAYHQQLDLERVVWGFPSFNLDHEEIAAQAEEFGRITTVINKYYTGDDAPTFLRLHTGQVFTLADVSFEIIYSHEDGVDATTGITKISDFNDTSTVARVTIGGQTMLFLADSHYKCAEPTMMKNWSAEYLKSDAMQLAHHGLYELDDIYKLIQAEIVFVPQSEYAIVTVASRKAALDVARSYLRNDMIFFQNEATVGIAVIDGQWEVVYFTPFQMHTDANGDFVCDVCTQTFQNPATCIHVDSKGYLYCELCLKALNNPTKCTHSDADGNLFCDNCTSSMETPVTEWLLDIPSYEGGTLASDVYIAGQGMNADMPTFDENLMQAVSGTSEKEFKAYIAKLEIADYEKEFYREIDNNLFASYFKDGIRVYAYFMSRTGEARIIMEYAKNSASLSDFGYVYEKQLGESTILYQYAFGMEDETHSRYDGFKNNGMFYIIKLADNSVIIIDGANTVQFPDSQCENLMNMLWDITGTQKGGKIRIAAWYITHAHGDHYQGFRQFTYSYSQYLDVERIAFGFPSVNSPNEKFNTGSGANGYRDIINTVNKYYADDNPVFLRLHTGQTFNIADVSFEVLYTHEDGVTATTGVSYITDYNDSSAVVRITIDGETFLVLGDASKKSAQKNLLANWSADHLKSDAIQMAHHALNDLKSLYHTVQASVLFVPQSQYAINTNDAGPIIFNVAKTYAREDMIFFENEYTVGIAVVDGKWEKVYTLPVIYEAIKP